jgi:gliding motility-associated-like protein
VAAPSLRCLDVQNNGNVKLTWIPPADPNNQFDSYEIFSSAIFNGPYSSVGTVGSIAINTFTHSTNTATSQSVYYYMITKYGAGGASTSGHSDTLRTIFVTPTQSNPDVKLAYNNLHTPALNSSSSSFTITKEYPSAIWNVLGITSALNYADTLSICSASINYQISLADVSGCVSLSNIKGGIFHDKKVPDQPIIDSISVLPNGQTILAWHIPRDMDINRYRIYEGIQGINTWIDSLNGRMNTSYTFTSTAADSHPVFLFSSAIDSCGNISSFDTQPATMFLQVKYNTCSYSTELTWSPYTLPMAGGFKEYRIYYSVNGSAFLPVGATSSTSFTHTGVSPSQNITYFIRAVNKSISVTSSSNRKSFFSTQAQAPAYAYIKSASIADGKCNVNVYVDASKISTGIDILRSQDGVTFSGITFLHSNGTPNYSYTDESVDPQNTSYYYQAIVHDSCGNARVNSNIAKTVLLHVTADKENLFNKHLLWTDYRGFMGNVSGYNIYRSVDDGTASIVGTTGPSDTSYVDSIEDEAPNGGKITYYVEAVEGISDPFGFLEKSQSNTQDVYPDDKIFIPTAFAPKGVNKTWMPVTHFVEKTEYNVSVFDRWGSKVFETTDDTKGWDGKNATPDVYVYLINYKNSRGEYKQLKGTLMLLE